MSATHLTFVRAQPGRSERLGACLQSLLEPTRRHAGCLSFEIDPVLNDPQLWRVRGTWQTPAAMQAYFAEPLLQRVLDQALHERLISSLDCSSSDRVQAA
jgi:quinol monooxygenase YgiN